MTGLTDVRDRTLTMLRALGIEPDRKQMRTVEKYVRWVDGQISTARTGVSPAFEVGRFPIRVSWTGDGYGWEKA